MAVQVEIPGRLTPLPPGPAVSESRPFFPVQLPTEVSNNQTLPLRICWPTNWTHGDLQPVRYVKWTLNCFKAKCLFVCAFVCKCWDPYT